MSFTKEEIKEAKEAFKNIEKELQMRDLDKTIYPPRVYTKDEVDEKLREQAKEIFKELEDYSMKCREAGCMFIFHFEELKQKWKKIN